MWRNGGRLEARLGGLVTASFAHFRVRLNKHYQGGEEPPGLKTLISKNLSLRATRLVP